MNELDLQIKEEIFRDKILNFYNNYKFLVIILFIIIIVLPICYQSILYYKKKINENILADYLKAEMLLSIDEKQAIKKLKVLQKSNNEIAIMLASGKLLDYSQEKVDIHFNESLIENKKQIKQNINLELNNIKNVIVKFDNISEEEILGMLKSNQEKEVFRSIKKKLLYDFYIKNNQTSKANQIKNAK